jgi:hypothetical protein
VVGGALRKGERVPQECGRRRVDLHFAALDAETTGGRNSDIRSYFEDAALDEEHTGDGLRLSPAT